MSAQQKIYHRNKSVKNTIELCRSKLVFKSRVALKNYLLSISKEIYDVPIKQGHRYYDFFCDMIDRHYEIKVEPEMKFVIHTEGGYGLSPERGKKRTPYRRTEYHRCYVFIPSKNDWDSFSLFHKCVNGKNDSDYALKNKEYRKIVEPQIKIARRMRPWQCELCEDEGVLDIDHYPKMFSEIVKEYEASTDEPTVEGFGIYHQEVAEYRLLCKSCHYENTFKKNPNNK